MGRAFFDNGLPANSSNASVKNDPRAKKEEYLFAPAKDNLSEKLHVPDSSAKDALKAIHDLASFLPAPAPAPEHKENPSLSLEEEQIVSGHYQGQLYGFTNNLLEHDIFNKPNGVFAMGTHIVRPLINKPGFRATVAMPTVINDTLELQIHFFGTLDFAAKCVDIEKGGPGQETLKKHEQELLEKINTMIGSLKACGKPIRLKIAGHSLGGALAKGFAHSLQRAMAVQDKAPEAIIDEVAKKNPSLSIDAPRLKAKLDKDREKFARLTELQAITGVTVYALGAPGVSKETDQDATALTYLQDPSFLRVYNQYHEKDSIQKHGETEFLSGNYGKPNVETHKSIIYSGEISAEAKKEATPLPFPGIGRTVMAAHEQTITNETPRRIINTIENREDHFVFPTYLWVLYQIVFYLLEKLAKCLPYGKLYSHPESEIAAPQFVSEHPGL